MDLDSSLTDVYGIDNGLNCQITIKSINFEISNLAMPASNFNMSFTQHDSRTQP